MLQFLGEITDFKLIIILTIALCAVLLISFSLHEFAHAFVAYKCGDSTGKALGRLTLNPFTHIDIAGFICCLLFGFGWAKPVPINPAQFRNYKLGVVSTSIAGVLVNLILAFLGCGLFYLFVYFVDVLSMHIYLYYLIFYFLQFMFSINLSLMIFNLLPIPPLDGYNIIAAVTKYDNPFVTFMQRYGTIILFVLIFVFDNLLLKLMNIIGAPIEMFWSWIFSLF